MMFVSDLDDTLYSEIDFVNSGCRAIARQLSAEGFMSESDALGVIQRAGSIASGFDDLARIVAEKGRGEAFGVERMLEIYRYHAPSIALRAEVKETFECLRAKGIGIGIITDGRSVTQHAKIKALGLDEFVCASDIVISEEIGADKNTDIPFRTLMSRHADEEKWLYIGDNPAKDFHWPNMMGWTTVMLENDGKNIPRQLPPLPAEYMAQHSIASFADVLQFVI